MSENTKTTENGKREESAKSPLSHARNQYISTITGIYLRSELKICSNI